MNIKLMLCLPVVFLLAGCPSPQKVYLLNNTSVAAILLLDDGKQKNWPGEEIVSIADRGGNSISWENLVWEGDPQSNYFPVLKVKCNQQIREYNLSLLYGYEDVKERNGRVIKYKLQLEDDCNLYMVPVGSRMPLKDISKKYLFVPIKIGHP